MPRQKRLTWNHALDTYATHLMARRSAKGTLTNHRLDLGHLRDYTDPLRVDQVKISDLRDYQCALLTGEGAQKKKPLAASTVARITTSIRAFFGFLTDEGLLNENPARRLERPRVPARLPGNVLTIREVKHLLATASQRSTPFALRDRALVELLYATGLRRQEACDLDLSDLDRTEREIRVRHGKGDKARIVPLTRSAFHQLTHYVELGRPGLVTTHPDSQQALFLSGWGQRIKTTGVWRALKQLAAEAGLKKNLSPHTMRRTFATHLLKGGASIRHIQLLLGHASLNVTAVYLRLDATELRREVLLHHPRERFEV